MANPQPENGLTSIAHEIAEAFCRINLSAYESRIVWFILRKTYGYHKTTDRISFSQFEEFTKLKHWHISRTLDRLLKRNIITRTGEGYNLIYGLQKDYDLWINQESVTKSSPIQVTKISTYSGDKSVPIQVTNPSVKSSPIQVESSPLQVELVPIQVTNLSPKEVHTKCRNIITNNITKCIDKKPYGEFKNIFLTDEEVIKLKERFGDKEAKERVLAASESFQSHKDYSKKYTDHYATILTWARMDTKRQNNGGNNGRKPETRASDRYEDVTGKMP